MVARKERPISNNFNEVSWRNISLIPAVPLQKDIIIWKIKNPGLKNIKYEKQSMLFGQTLSEARNVISQVLPLTSESPIQLIILESEKMEEIRNKLNYPKGIVGFPYEGKYIYNQTGQLANTEGGFENLPPDKKRGAVHELTHLLPGMSNLPYWLAEGFCEAVPRFLAGFQNVLRDVYFKEQFTKEIVPPEALEEISRRPNPNFFTDPPTDIGVNRNYMSALAYVIGLALQKGEGNIQEGLREFYNLVQHSTSSDQLGAELDKILETVIGEQNLVKNSVQQKGINFLTHI